MLRLAGTTEPHVVHDRRHLASGRDGQMSRAMHYEVVSATLADQVRG